MPADTSPTARPSFLPIIPTSGTVAQPVINDRSRYPHHGCSPIHRIHSVFSQWLLSLYRRVKTSNADRTGERSASHASSQDQISSSQNSVNIPPTLNPAATI